MGKRREEKRRKGGGLRDVGDLPRGVEMWGVDKEGRKGGSKGGREGVREGGCANSSDLRLNYFKDIRNIIDPLLSPLKTMTPDGHHITTSDTSLHPHHYIRPT